MTKIQDSQCCKQHMNMLRTHYVACFPLLFKCIFLQDINDEHFLNHSKYKSKLSFTLQSQQVSVYLSNVSAIFLKL